MIPNIFESTNGVNLPAMAADIYCAYIAIILIISFRTHRDFLRYPPTAIYHKRQRIMGRITVPDLSLKETLGCHILLIIFLIMAIVSNGWLNRFCLLLAIICYFGTFAKTEGLETNKRKTYLIPVFLAIFLVTPMVGDTWNSEAPYWPIWALKLALCQIYVSGAIQKIKFSGWAWSNSMGGHLLRLSLFEDLPRARWLAKHPAFSKMFARFVFAMQASFWIILIIPWVTPIYLIAGLLFHVGTAFFMRIYYLKYIIGAYAILLLDSLYWYLPFSAWEPLLG